MVRSARVVRDAAGAFATLRGTVRRTDALRVERRGELLDRYREQVDGLLCAARQTTAAQAGPTLARLLMVRVGGWCLRRAAWCASPGSSRCWRRSPRAIPRSTPSLPPRSRSRGTRWIPLVHAAALLFAADA